MKRRLLPVGLVPLLLILLTGCGFQLRGAPPVPATLSPLALECGASVPDALCDEVERELALSGLLADSDEEAANVLSLQDFDRNRRVSAFTATAGAAEYEVTMLVRVSLITHDGVPLLGRTRVDTVEAWRFDETSLLARQREEAELNERLHDRLARLVLFRMTPFTEDRVQQIRDAHAAAQQEN